MRRSLLAALSILSLLPGAAACAPATASAELPATVQWRVDSAGRSDGRIQFELSYRTARTHSVHSRTADLAELQGLSREALQASSGAVAFRLPRDAGTFECRGVARRGRASGDCGFAPSASFAAELERRGFGRPSELQLFHLAMSGTGLGFVRELDRQGYRSTVDEMVEAANHGVDEAYLREMGGHGYRTGSLQALVRMRDHGVSSDYVRELVAAGLRDLPPETLIEMRDHGVSPAYIGELRRLGYSDVPVRDLIELRDHGVDAGYVRALAENGLRSLPLRDVVRLRDHGVTPEFAGAVRKAGYADGAEPIVRLRDHGVSGDFVRDLGALGYGRLDPDDVIRLRDHGVTADFIRRANAGGGRRSPEDLIRLRIGA